MSEQRIRIKTEDQTIWIIGWIAHQDDLNEKDEFILIFKIVLSLGIGWFAHQDDLKEKDECILFLKIVLGKMASATRNWINSPPPPLTQMRRPLPLVLSLSFLYGELAVCSMPVPCSGLAMAPGGKFFFSLLCTNKELARFRLGGGEEEEGVGGGKLEAVDSTPSQHALAIHSMQFSPWGDLVLLGESLSAVQSMLRTRIRGTRIILPQIRIQTWF